MVPLTTNLTVLQMLVLFPNMHNTIYFQSHEKAAFVHFAQILHLQSVEEGGQGVLTPSYPELEPPHFILRIFIQLESLKRKKTILFSNPESSCPSIFCLSSDCKLASVYFNSCLSFTILPYTTRCNQLTLSKILLQIIFPMSKTSQFLSPMLLQESVFNSCLAI